MSIPHDQSCGKHRYPDKKAALSAINFRKRDHRNKRGKQKHLRAYPCPDCHGWHLTHHTHFKRRRPSQFRPLDPL